MHMPTASSIDKALLDKARALTGLRDKTAILNAGLQALIARESARRLVALGGTQKNLRTAPRRRQRPSRGS